MLHSVDLVYISHLNYKDCVDKMSTWALLGLIITVLVVVSPVSSLRENETCRTPKGDKGKCIPFKKCASLVTLIQKNPLYDDDYQFLRSSECGRTPGILVCCADLSRTPDQSLPDTSTVSSNLLPTIDICKADFNNRIIGGEVAELEEYPWTVLLQYDKPNRRTGFHCGGVLINQRYVLTAAHCMVHPDIKRMRWVLSSVRLGEYDLSTEIDCYNGDCIDDKPVDIKVEKLILHENYTSGSRSNANDIALIRLSRPVTYTKYIKPLCLPFGDRLKSIAYDDLPLEIAGWGQTENGTSSNVKRKLTIPGVPNSQCRTFYQQRRNPVTITEKQLCAGGIAGKDSCSGDSGGPMMTVDRSDPQMEYWYLAGVVSFGPTPCAQAGFPGVYTRISAYTDWIVKNIRP